LIIETFERTPAAVCECDLVWHTADSCWWGDWWMEMMITSLCPWKGMPFWTLL